MSDEQSPWRIATELHRKAMAACDKGFGAYRARERIDARDHFMEALLYERGAIGCLIGLHGHECADDADRSREVLRNSANAIADWVDKMNAEIS